MAALHTNMKLPKETRDRLAYEFAMKESYAAGAIKDLGDLLHLSRDHGGFEGLEDKHWRAIGIAIEQLADSLYSGSIADNLNDAPSPNKQEDTE